MMAGELANPEARKINVLWLSVEKKPRCGLGQCSVGLESSSRRPLNDMKAALEAGESALIEV